jgi:hypothetical protein
LTNDQINPAPDDMLAQGGGHATAAGVSFQAQLGAALACQLLAERPIDTRLGIAGARIRSLRFETEAPIDDVLVETDEGGWVFIQAKTALTLSTGSDSELGKTAEQLVRLWLSCSAGSGKHGWDRPLQADIDRVLIAVGRGSAGTVVNHLAAALVASRAVTRAPLPQNQQHALDTLVELIRSAWPKFTGQSPNDEAISGLLRHVAVLPFDFEGADGTSAATTLAHVLEDLQDATGAFLVLAHHCEQLMAKRLGADAAGFRTVLATANIALLAPPSFTADVARLRSYSERVETHLARYEGTKVGDAIIKIDRRCIRAVTDAAIDESLLLVGDPGAGKSAVVSAAGGRLRSQGYEVIELAVDRLQIASLEGLRQELGLGHSLVQVLLNWPSDGPAFLMIDA